MITLTRHPRYRIVASVYSGIDGKCCCGCSGKHTYASVHRAWAEADRGYPIRDEEVNDRVVARHLRKIQSLVDQGVAVEEGPNHIAVVEGRRVYIAYFRTDCAAVDDPTTT